MALRRQVSWVFQSYDKRILQHETKVVQHVLDQYCKEQVWSKAGEKPLWEQTKPPSYVYLPTQNRRYTILRSTFVNKKHRDQFEFINHRRGIYLKFAPTVEAAASEDAETLDAWFEDNIIANLEAQIKLVDGALPGEMSAKMTCRR